MLRGVDAIDPATGEVIASYAAHTPRQVAQRLAAARSAFERWRRTNPDERAAALRRVGAVLSSRKDVLAGLAVSEMGKPVLQAVAEVEKCSWVCEHYATHGAGYLAPRPAATDAAESFVRHDPLGVLLAVMPWNFPFWQVFRCAVPALMAGDSVLLKHASNVPGCALAIEEVFADAGLPPGTFATLLVGGAEVAGLVADPAVAAVSLTGSEAAGAVVGAAAGRALKPCVLELGGSDPFIVLADADLDTVVPQAVTARIQNNGQSCIAAKRFIVEAPLRERFEETLVECFRALRVGPPMERTNHLGPLARADLRDELHAQVERSVAAGARLRCGGRARPGPGFYYEPTVLGGVTPGMAAFDEETFGPLAPVIEARDEAHAVELANASRFGLGASVWTGDPSRGAALAPAIEAGAVFVNGIVKSDPRLPFGGIKASGFGRELAAEGILAFTDVKTVWVR
jgi:succinate-semialdehyde dehydrogenase/glutarate-semialdehyde dehydrogenase